MSEIFLKVVNMSIAASWLVPVVLLMRLALKKAPKWVRVLLWGIVGVRLSCPFAFESVVSLIPSAETISPGIMLERTPQISTGIESLNSVVNPVITAAFAPDPLVSANPLQLLIPMAAVVWAAGVVAMLCYTAVSCWLLNRKVAAAVRLRDNIFQSEYVDSPFVFGIIRPRIYLPFGMDGQNLAHVVAHEQAHIHRKDHWWKPLGFLLLAVHWFNPLLWLAYILLCRDIELACDEKVIREMDSGARADYTQALVACSVSRRSVAACPLAFGEVGVKDRVRSVLHYKRPAFWLIVAAVVACAAVAVCFLTDPRTTLDQELAVFIDGQIAEHHHSPGHSDGHFAAIDYRVLDVRKSFGQTTVYMWVLYQEYSCENGKITEESGAHIPTVITVGSTGGHGHYTLTEYWEPRDGSYYARDIRAKFPWYLHGKALDSQRYIAQQEAFCRNAAEEYFFSASHIGGADGPVMTYGQVKLTETASDTLESFYHVSGYLPGTDLSSPGQALEQRIRQEWAAFDAMTQQQQLSSSHLWGCVTVEADTWQACEEVVGIGIPNPLASVDWLTKSGYFGKESADPDQSVAHVRATADATAAKDRKLSRIHIQSGYTHNAVSVTITATVCAEGGMLTTGMTSHGYATYRAEQAKTGTGIPVLVVTPDEANNTGYYQEDYYDRIAYWVADNVFYTLRVAGTEKKRAEVDTVLEKLLAAI